MATYVKKRMGDGSMRWQAVVRRDGRLKKKTTRTRAAAERWARTTEAAIDDGRALPAVEDERRSVAQAVDAYLDSGAVTGLRSEHLRRQHLDWWRERLGGQRLRDLSREAIRGALAALAAGETPRRRPVAPGTRRRYLVTLRACLAWCVDSRWIAGNPAAGAARKGLDVEPPGRTRYLTDAERAKLLAAVDAERDPRLAAVTRLALLTGMRLGELMGLRWADVDLDRGLASLPRTKAGHPRPVALSAPAVEILRELRSHRVVGWEHVFAGRPHGAPLFPRSAWNRAVVKAELDDFRFHDLRHTFASALLSAGASLPELAAALGHRTLAMVQRYAHLEKAHAARLVERVAERLST